MGDRLDKLDQPWRLMPWMTTRKLRLRWHWVLHITHYRDGDVLRGERHCSACGYAPRV